MGVIYSILEALIPFEFIDYAFMKNALIAINRIETIVPEVSCDNPLYLHTSIIICPIEQINPPTQKALKQSFNIGEFGDFLLT